jgi:hypothetical protein
MGIAMPSQLPHRHGWRDGPIHLDKKMARLFQPRHAP